MPRGGPPAPGGTSGPPVPSAGALDGPEGPRRRRVVLVACVGTAIAVAGVQGIAPALPAMQDHYGLSTAQVSLLTSLYLLPSIGSAFGSGVLADRVGPRPVFAGALALFGLCGLAVVLLSPALGVLLAIRAVQGAAFGAVLALSIVVIGAVAPAGPEAARAQGRRTVSMAIAEASLPPVAGLLVAVSWSTPFALQALALPVAAWAWRAVPGGLQHGRRRGGGGLRAVLAEPAVGAVQVLGIVRFVAKFAILTYVPVLAVGALGMTPAQIGLWLGVSAALGAFAAWRTEPLARRWSASTLVAAGLVAMTTALLAMGAGGLLAVAPLLVAGLLLHGVQDGVDGVSHNVLVFELAPPAARGAYVGLAATTRNLGKFAAPLVLGGLTLVLTVAQGFLAMAALGAVAAPAARRVAQARRAGVPPPPAPAPSAPAPPDPDATADGG